MFFDYLYIFNYWHRLVAEELAKFHEASRGSELYVDKSCRAGDMNWMDPFSRNVINNLKEVEARGEHSNVYVHISMWNSTLFKEDNFPLTISGSVRITET